MKTENRILVGFICIGLLLITISTVFFRTNEYTNFRIESVTWDNPMKADGEDAYYVCTDKGQMILTLSEIVENLKKTDYFGE